MNKGFSLVQILISLGLMGFIFVAGFQIFESQTKLGKSSSFIFESMIVLDEMKSVLSDPLSCKATLGGKSVVFDEVSSVKKFDSNEGIGLDEYIVSSNKDKKNLYGQGNIIIENISFYGDHSGFKSTNNYGLIQVNFKEVEGTERYKGLFPLKVYSNDLGRIEVCQSTPGLHLGTSSSGESGPWVRVKNERGDNGVYSGEKVSLGNVPSIAKFNVEGGALFWIEELKSNTCEVESGLIYSQKDDALFLCENKSWKNISQGKSLKFEGVEFSLEGVGSELQTLRPEGDFHYCLLVRMQGAQGECRTQRLEKGHWELLLNATPGYALECDFKCF